MHTKALIKPLLASLVCTAILTGCSLTGGAPSSPAIDTAGKTTAENSPRPGAPGTRLTGRVSVKGPTPPVETTRLGDYLLEIFGPEGESGPYLVFSKAGKAVYKKHVAKLDKLTLVNSWEDSQGSPLCKLTGEGDPNVVIMHNIDETSGECLVFSLGNTAKLIATIKCGTGPPTFTSKGANDRVGLVFTESYDDWGAHGFVSLPLVFRCKHSKFILDKRAMINRLHTCGECSPITDAQRNRWMTEEFERGDPQMNLPITLAPVELGEAIVTMYYCGEVRRARRLLDECWPKRRPGKSLYWSFLVSRMRQSPYWPAVAALNSGT